MSKKLYLVRHATAEELGNTKMIRDFDRELTSRGIMESARMGSYLKETIGDIELFITSDAERAKSTAKIFAERFKKDVDSIQIDEGLYGGGPRAYLALLNQIPENCKSVAIFGHNPDISFFAEYLTRDDTGGSMGKATVICLTIEDIQWAEISSKAMSLAFRISKEDLNEK